MVSAVECWSIPSVNTLCKRHDQYLVRTLSTPWLTLDWHSIGILVDSQLIFDQCTRQLTFDTVGHLTHLANYQATVDQVLTAYRWACQSSADRDVDPRYWLTLDRKCLFSTNEPANEWALFFLYMSLALKESIFFFPVPGCKNTNSRTCPLVKF